MQASRSSARNLRRGSGNCESFPNLEKDPLWIARANICMQTAFLSDLHISNFETGFGGWTYGFVVLPAHLALDFELGKVGLRHLSLKPRPPPRTLNLTLNPAPYPINPER